MRKNSRASVYLCLCLFSSKSLQEKKTCRCTLSESLANTPDDDDELKVGIIGGGHLGKQLARVLLQLVPVPAERLRISTRRPEALGEEQCPVEGGLGQRGQCERGIFACSIAEFSTV